MQITQGRDRNPAQWHYADQHGLPCGPYPAAGLVRLFQFGHIRLDTPVWHDDPAAARPLRDCTESFEIGPGSRIRLAPLPSAPAVEAAPASSAAADDAVDAAQLPPAGEPADDAAAQAPAAERHPASVPPTPAVPRWVRPAAAIVAALLAVTAVALRFAT
ncbi:hypothetical protein [Luteimonas salinilitoris]|uniref:Uncharacterized protein n=1 Tax=Luteimonas salinilitoris TaxID=3237697 RepID=A0ABV4HSX5_9GAMM